MRLPVHVVISPVSSSDCVARHKILYTSHLGSGFEQASTILELKYLLLLMEQPTWEQLS
jgi:hypothetical protein